MTVTSTSHRPDPRRAQAGRRPLRLRPLEGAAGGAGEAGRAVGADGHLAPPGAGPRPGRPGARGPRRALRRCPTATRSRSATAAPPPSGTPPRPGSCASAPCTSPTASSRRSSPRRPPARRSSPTRSWSRPSPATRPAPAADPAADAIAWAHNETSTGVMVPVRRPEGAGDALVLDRRDLRRRRPAARRRPGRRLLLRPAEGLRRRRRPLAGRCSARPRSSGSSELDGAAGRWQPGFLSLQTALENSRKEQTYNTPALATLLLLADQVEWMLAGGGLDWCVERTRASSGHLYGWAEAQRVRHALRRRPGEALAGRRHDRLRRLGRRRRARRDPARQRHRRRRALPQAGPQPAAGRHVPGGRAGRRRGADRLHRLGGRERRGEARP